MTTLPASLSPHAEPGGSDHKPHAPNDGAREPAPREHLRELDGWRGISILAVLACHLLPLGPKSLQLNWSAGMFGMSIFFCLSGFLITSFLLRRPEVSSFIIRRLCRILPLAYLYLVVLMLWLHAPWQGWLANLGFVENYQTEYLWDLNAHFWSLCVEMQFYLGIVVAVCLFRRWWRWTIPAVCILVTGLRIWYGAYESIYTHLRVDEILVGGCLALLYTSPSAHAASWLFRKLAPPLAVLLLLASTSAFSGALQYGRPYFAALAVGSVLFQPQHWLSGLLRAKSLRYIAEISYALYVIHPVTAAGWMSAGPVWQKYLLKRPISFALTFALAHLSTFHWESRWIALGKRWTSSPRAVAHSE